MHYFRITMRALPFLLPAIANAAYICDEFTVPMSIKTESLTPKFPEFEDHYQSVAFLTSLAGSDSAGSPVGAAVNISLDLKINAKYCRPRGFHSVRSPKTIQILTHGLGFDHSYWDFGGEESEYNYIKAATEAGFATLSYDRIGTGKSTVTDPYKEQQLGVEVTVAATLTSFLREGKLSSFANCHIPIPNKVAHVGHSFGSLITSTLAGSSPELSDAVVLTGFSTDSTYANFFAISTDFHLAAETVPERFGNLSNGYLTWGDELSNQFGFFHYPGFDPAVLATAEATKWPLAIGEFLSPYNIPQPKWKGPLLMISGQQDYIFCGANCTGVLEKGRKVYPNAEPFATYLQPETGHGMNLHYNATGYYDVVNDFVKEQLGM